MKTLTLETKGSRLQLDLQRGGSIQKLILSSSRTKSTKEVITGDDSQDFFLSGSYLLYPWVNRIANRWIQYKQKSILLDPPAIDANEYPIHGLFFSTKRIPLQTEETDRVSSVHLCSEWNHPKFPIFTETFTLYPDRLQILTKFENTTTSTQYFSYGYHPYFQLDTQINTCTLSTNLDTILPLRKDLLPEAYFLEGHRKYLFQDGERINTLELDHCLTNLQGTESPFVRFHFPFSGESITVSSTLDPDFIPLPFFQLYTPPHRKTIAIEPLSSSGNVFENPITSPVELQALSTRKGRIEFLYE